VVPGYAAVRDTKFRAGGHVAVPARSFVAFLRSVSGRQRIGKAMSQTASSGPAASKSPK
jgi:hypothetical protein